MQQPSGQNTEPEVLSIYMKFLSLAALEVVMLTTSSAANDENFVKIMTVL